VKEKGIDYLSRDPFLKRTIPRNGREKKRKMDCSTVRKRREGKKKRTYLLPLLNDSGDRKEKIDIS